MRIDMPASAFKAGDRVELKSGGPAMTVSSVASNKVTCVWWDQPKQAYTERIFESAVLQAWVALTDPGGCFGTADD